MDYVEIQSVLQTFGERVPPASSLVLIGGSALILLGSSRLTIDVDFVGDDIHPSELHKLIIQIAKDLKINVEPVPMEQFVPLPEGSAERAIRIGQFGNLEVFVADPYSIALTKLDRGFDTDIEDIIFLIENNHIDMDNLEHILSEALLHARQYDFNPDIPSHLGILKSRLRKSQ